MSKLININSIYRVVTSALLISLIVILSITVSALAKDTPTQKYVNHAYGFMNQELGQFEDLELFCTDDVDGPNDEPGQKDLTRMCVNSSSDPVLIDFNWDEIYGGGANTYDACSLFDNDGDGNANYSFCTTVSANPISDIMEYQSVTLYSCGDDKPDRCTQPVNIEVPSVGTGCTVSQEELDPFPAGAEYPLDTVGSCSIVRSDITGSAAVLLNVCSFPSQQPNSDPSDCIVEPSSGFITIVKEAIPDIDTVPFEFAINDGEIDVFNPIIYGSGISDRLSVIEGIYSVTELVPQDWNLDSASCTEVIDGSVGIPNLSASGVFEIIVQSGNDITCTFTDSRLYTPALSTTPEPTMGYVGDTLQDTAILSGGYNPTGTISFKLYDPADANCSGLAVYTEVVLVNGNGNYSTTSGFAANKDGIFRWVAEYSGDTYNSPAASGCEDEQVTILKHTTNLTTLPNPTIGWVGDMLNDSATVTSNHALTGNVTFNLYEPGDDTCQTPVFTQSVPLVGGTATTSPGYMSDMEGTWRWTANYPGDFANLPSSSGCQEELVLISINPTNITTTPNPTTGKVGDILNDSAIVTSDYDLTGTVTFKLYPPGDDTCLEPVFSQIVPVGDGNVSTNPGYQNNIAGTWRWTAEYSGDFANAPSSSGCNDELVIIDKYDPSITTQPNPSSGLVGITLNDTAILTSDFELTGEVLFKLFEPGDVTCQTPVYTQTVPVNSTTEATIEVSTNPGYPSDIAGTWRWTAEYLGDFANYPSTSGCDDELVILSKHSPTIQTTPDPVIGFIWDRLNDSATLSGGFNATGNVTFSLYQPGDTTCQSAIYEEIVVITDDQANTVIGFLSNQSGVWRWKAAYSGDVNNNPAVSGCDDELVTIQLYNLFLPFLANDPTPPICSFTWRQTYNGYQVRLDLTWENAAAPGEAPEDHRIKWGDNTHTLFTGESGSRPFWHTYQQPGWYFVYIVLWGHDGEKYFPCSGWVDPP